MKLLVILSLMSFSTYSKDFTFIGVQMGASNVKSDINSEDNNESGQMFGLSLGKEYKFDKINLNVGVEYNNHKVNTDLDTDKFTKVELESNYLTVSINPTYSFDKIDIGFKADFALSNDGILVTQEDSARSLVGVNAFYNINHKDNKMRVGLFAQKSLEQDYSQAGVSFQYAFGTVKKVSKVKAKKKEYITSITFKDDVVRFENDSAKLSLSSKAFLAELGTYLHEHSYNWKHLEIIGHTSKDGKLDYNKYLSYKRTNAVFAVLQEMGVSARKVTLKGKGELSPLVVEKTLADKRKNRRVELIFVGMKKDKDLKRFIDILRKKHK